MRRHACGQGSKPPLWIIICCVTAPCCSQNAYVSAPCARLKRRCGRVTPGVLSDVERLLRQLRATPGINGQCTTNNLKRVLMDQGLCSNGPKAELVQQIHNYTIPRKIMTF